MKKLKLKIQLKNIDRIKDIQLSRKRYMNLIKMMHNLSIRNGSSTHIDSVFLFNHLQEKCHCSRDEYAEFLEKMEEDGIIMTNLNDIFIL